MSNEISLCSVVNCRNSDRSKISSTVFYFLPTDPVVAAQWTEALKDRICGAPTDHSKIAICIEHFSQGAWIQGSIKLKHGSIPSIFPSSNPESGQAESITSQNSESEILPSSFYVKLEPGKNNQAVANELLADPIPHELTNIGVNDRRTELERAFFLNRIRQLNEQKQKLIEENEKLTQLHAEAHSELLEARKEISEKKALRKKRPKEEQGLLKKCFSPRQIRMLYGQSKCRWTLDDLAMAYTVRSLGSREFYLHMRNNLKYPLPGLSSFSKCYGIKSRKKEENSAGGGDVNEH